MNRLITPPHTNNSSGTAAFMETLRTHYTGGNHGYDVR